MSEVEVGRTHLVQHVIDPAIHRPSRVVIAASLWHVIKLCGYPAVRHHQALPPCYGSAQTTGRWMGYRGKIPTPCHTWTSPWIWSRRTPGSPLWISAVAIIRFLSPQRPDPRLPSAPGEGCGGSALDFLMLDGQGAFWYSLSAVPGVHQGHPGAWHLH